MEKVDKEVDDSYKKQILELFEITLAAYKNKAYGAAYICSLIFPDLCAQADGDERGSGIRYSDWWEKHISPALTFSINDNTNYHLSGKLGYQLRCAVFHEGTFIGDKIMKELNSYYKENYPTDKEISVDFFPTASHNALIVTDNGSNELSPIKIQVWINPEDFVYTVLRIVSKRYLGEKCFDYYLKNVSFD